MLWDGHRHRSLKKQFYSRILEYKNYIYTLNIYIFIIEPHYLKFLCSKSSLYSILIFTYSPSSSFHLHITVNKDMNKQEKHVISAFGIKLSQMLRIFPHFGKHCSWFFLDEYTVVGQFWKLYVRVVSRWLLGGADWWSKRMSCYPMREEQFSTFNIAQPRKQSYT